MDPALTPPIDINHRQTFALSKTLPELGQSPQKLWHPFIDFWLLGGASIALLLVMSIGWFFREDSAGVQNHFLQLAAVFSLLAIVCNHPHFLIGYSFAYTRGLKFLLRNWIELIVVPLGLIAVYCVAYFNYGADISESSFVLGANHLFEHIGIGFRLGRMISLGSEIMGLSIWLMYFTVGWHYSKQVFGCMMVYSRYDQYPLTAFARNVIKGSVFSVAFFQLIYAAHNIDASSSASYRDSNFMNTTISPLGLPLWLLTLSSVLTAVFALLVITVLVRNYLQTRRLPSPTFLVTWVAFHLWWIPFMDMPEYYLMAVPFFHSLQYLPFAYKIEAGKVRKNNWTYAHLTARFLFLLVVGYMAFEAIPTALDNHLNTEHFQTAWFFVTAFAVFINIHHFFIDSVVWKFTDPVVKKALL